MRVLVTGHLGFLGRHVVRLLVEAHHRVIGFDERTDLASSDCPFLQNFHDLYGHNFDAIVHCAAHADIKDNHLPEERERLWESNVQLTFHLVEWAHASSTFIFCSTGAVYGDRPLDQAPFSHERRTRPESLYAATKVAGEAFVAAKGFKRHYNLRLCSLVGPGYNHGHIKDFVAQAYAHGKVSPCCNGTQRKHYRDVRDAAAIIRDLVDGARDSGTYNVGGEPWSIADTVALMGSEVVWPENLRGWPGDPLDIQLQDDFGHRFLRSPISQSVQETLDYLGWRRECST